MINKFSTKSTWALCLSIALLGSGCTSHSLLGLTAVLPIRSFGNIVDVKQFNQLVAGMTKEQVAYIIGSPVLSTPFNPYTWDYSLMVYQGNKELKNVQFQVHFDQEEKLETWGFLQGTADDLVDSGNFEKVEENKLLKQGTPTDRQDNDSSEVEGSSEGRSEDSSEVESDPEQEGGDEISEPSEQEDSE